MDTYSPPAPEAMQAVTDETAPRPSGAEEASDQHAGRIAGAMALSTTAAAIMTGGIYIGLSARVWAAVAGVLGVLLAAQVRRVAHPVASNAAIAGGLFGIGILLTVPAGSLADVTNLAPFIREAVTSGEVLRPPVELTLGWRAIIGWLMGGLGFAAAWVGLELRRPALGLLLPVPIVAVAAISVPAEAKLGSGIASLAVFAAALGVLSGADSSEPGQARPLSFELRRTARAVPVIAVLAAVMYLLGTNAQFLFPRPLYDPAQSAQRPRVVPLTEVPDRVLFTVQSSVTGPWRMGSLDVYDGVDWRLPPFAESQLDEVPRDGIVDSELAPGVQATFEVHDLGGAILPGLPNTVGIVAQGPRLAFDARSGNLRLSQGTIQPGLQYIVVASRIPSVDELRNADAEPPAEVRERFLDGMPPAPPAVVALLDRAPKTSRWDTMDYARQELLRTVVATGPGIPVSVAPDRVQDMLAGSREGSPYEIVAAQAMLARWAGVPARIGYGFDGGERVGNLVEVRPRHGASFLEVWFPGYKWLPVIGSPAQARATFGGDHSQQERQTLASDEIATQIFVPFETDPRAYVFEQVRAALAVMVPLLVAALAAYLLWPVLRKAVMRARRRTWAQRRGSAARIAVAYAEWRDACTDLGYHQLGDTPLMFLQRTPPDEEHAELAWLVTRTTWGDLQDTITGSDALAAEELSRSLRRRAAQAHPWTLRLVAAASRLSIRHPYAVALDARPSQEPERALATVG